MNFHACYNFYDSGKDVHRENCMEYSEVSYNYYRNLFVPKPISNGANVKVSKLAKVKDLSYKCGEDNFDGNIIKISSYGTAIFKLCIPDKVGIGGLFLSGKLPSIETKYCLDFQKRTYRDTKEQVRKEIPPLEIDKRPLFYYTVFNLNDNVMEDIDWKKLLIWTNGLGLVICE